MSDTSRISRTIKGQQEATGLGKTTIYELIKRGELPVVPVFNRTLILDEDMLACLRRRREFRGPNGSAAAPEPEAGSTDTSVVPQANNGRRDFSAASTSAAQPSPADRRRRRGRSAEAARPPPK
jgi:hypothetical protein